MGNRSAVCFKTAIKNSKRAELIQSTARRGGSHQPALQSFCPHSYSTSLTTCTTICNLRFNAFTKAKRENVHCKSFYLMIKQLIQWRFSEFDFTSKSGRQYFFVFGPTQTENQQGQEVLRNNRVCYFFVHSATKRKSADTVRRQHIMSQPLHCGTKSIIQKNISSATQCWFRATQCWLVYMLLV